MHRKLNKLTNRKLKLLNCNKKSDKVQEYLQELILLKPVEEPYQEKEDFKKMK